MEFMKSEQGLAACLKTLSHHHAELQGPFPTAPKEQPPLLTWACIQEWDRNHLHTQGVLMRDAEAVHDS